MNGQFDCDLNKLKRGGGHMDADALNRDIADGYRRVVDFVLEAAAAGRPARDRWLDAVHDAATDLDRIATSTLAHPDDVQRAQAAMFALSHIWLDVEETEALYLGDREL